MLSEIYGLIRIHVSRVLLDGQYHVWLINSGKAGGRILLKSFVDGEASSAYKLAATLAETLGIDWSYRED